MAKRTMAPAVRVFPAAASSLATIRRFIDEQAAAVGLPPANRQDIALAVTEGCSNAIRHSTTPEVTVSWEAEPGVVVVHVADQGIFRAPAPQPSGIGGFGIPLMRALADDLAIRQGSPRRPGTVVRLVWRTADARRRAPGAAGPAGRPAGQGAPRPAPNGASSLRRGPEARPGDLRRAQRAPGPAMSGSSGGPRAPGPAVSGPPGGGPPVSGPPGGGPPGPGPGPAGGDGSDPAAGRGHSASDARLRFLARVSVAFGQAPIDARRVLEALVGAAVPDLADYVLLRLVGAEASLGDLEVRHVISAMAGPARDLEVLESTRPGYPVAQAIKTGQSQVIPEVSAGRRDAGEDPARDRAREELLGRLGPRSALVVPILVRGAVVAVLSLVTSVASGRRYTRNDLELVEDLARRAGLALDNARLEGGERAARAAAEAARSESAGTRADMSVLLDVGAALSTSPGASEGLLRLARLAVGSFADVCLIDVAQGDGAPRRVAAEVADPELLELAEQVPAEEAATKLGFLSSIHLPLAARGGVLGSLTLGTTALSGRHYREADRRLAEDLARRAGYMLDRAGVADEQRAMARALRQSLVPAELPEIPGIELAARSLPGAGDTDVTGVFADVLSLGRDRWMVAVGCPVQKGPEGAWLAALVRSTMRAAALDEELPSRMLATVNAALRRLAPGRGCRLACAFVEPRDGGAAMTVGLAGHQPPLVVTAGGGMAQVGRPAEPLGSRSEGTYADEPVALRLGDAVVFMTGAGRDPDGATAADDQAMVANARADSDGTARSLAAALATSLEQAGPLSEDGELIVLRLLARFR